MPMNRNILLTLVTGQYDRCLLRLRYGALSILTIPVAVAYVLSTRVWIRIYAWLILLSNPRAAACVVTSSVRYAQDG